MRESMLVAAAIPVVAIVVALLLAVAPQTNPPAGGQAASKRKPPSGAPGAFGGGDNSIVYPRSAKGMRVWTVDELAKHDGSNHTLPLLLAICGEVFDVGPGSRFYAPGGGYSHMGGCDNSRAFTSVDDEDETAGGASRGNSQLLDLSQEQVDDVLNWRKFYREHKEYRQVGHLHERYFDAQGSPTPEWMRLEELGVAGLNAKEEEKKFNKRFMACNSKYEAAKPYVEFWCNDGYHPKGSMPVHLYFRLREQDEEKGRCACLPPDLRAKAKEEAMRPQPGKPTFRFVDYVDCEAPGQMCRRPKGAMPP